MNTILLYLVCQKTATYIYCGVRLHPESIVHHPQLYRGLQEASFARGGCMDVSENAWHVADPQDEKPDTIKAKLALSDPASSGKLYKRTFS